MRLNNFPIRLPTEKSQSGSPPKKSIKGSRILRLIVSLVLPVMASGPGGAWFSHFRKASKEVMVLPERTDPTQRFNRDPSGSEEVRIERCGRVLRDGIFHGISYLPTGNPVFLA